VTRTVGVIGGMGPRAAVAFQQMLLDATPAADDDGHIHVITDNNPQVPSRIRALIDGDGGDPAPELQRMARCLEDAGADFLVMPCNTAHHYHSRIMEAVAIPLLDMVGIAARSMHALPGSPARIGLLASPAVRLTGLYEAPLAGCGLTAIHPEGADAQALLDVIRSVKAEGRSPEAEAAYARLAGALASSCDALLVACTELSMLAPPAPGIAIRDSLVLLAGEAVARAMDGPTGD